MSSSQAFTPRICATGEDTGDTLGSITPILTGSLIDSFNVCPTPPPFVQAILTPITPPPVSTWYPKTTCVVRSGAITDRAEAGCTDSCGCRFFYDTATSELWFDDCDNEEWILVNPCVLLEAPCSERPEAGTQSCRLFFATDTEQLFLDNQDEEDPRWILLNKCTSTTGLLEEMPETPICDDDCAEDSDKACMFYYTTDTNELYYADCDNEEWVSVGGCTVLEDLCANRPDPCSQPCRFFYATDTGMMYYDDCEQMKWVPVNKKPIMEGLDEELPVEPPCPDDEADCSNSDFENYFYFATDTGTLYYANCSESSGGTGGEWIVVNTCAVLEGDLADRPESCSQGCRLYWAIDIQQLYYDDCYNEQWVVLGGGSFDATTADTIGDCDTDTEETIDSDYPIMWDVDNQDPEEEGLLLTVFTRVVYSASEDGGSDILYGYCRTLGFDTAGKLATVSAETREIIDTPEECS